MNINFSHPILSSFVYGSRLSAGTMDRAGLGRSRALLCTGRDLREESGSLNPTTWGKRNKVLRHVQGRSRKSPLRERAHPGPG